MHQPIAKSQLAPEQRQASSLDALNPDDEIASASTFESVADTRSAADDNAFRGPLDFPFAIGASIILWILLGLIAISLFG